MLRALVHSVLKENSLMCIKKKKYVFKESDNCVFKESVCLKRVITVCLKRVITVC